MHFKSQPFDDAVTIELLITLPRSLAFEQEQVIVVFAGAFTNDEQMTHMKKYIVRIDLIRTALQWLKKNNPLYADVEISERSLSALRNQILATQADDIASATDAAEEGVGYARRHEDVEISTEQSAIVQPTMIEATDQQRVQRELERRAGDLAVVQRSGQLYTEAQYNVRTHVGLYPYGCGDPASTVRPVKISFANAVNTQLNHL